MNNVSEWNTAYQKNDGKHKNLYPSDLVVSWVMRNYKGLEDITCLDIGCGYGNNLRFLLNENFDAYGCDISSAVISSISNEFGRRVLVNKPNILPYKDNTFDFIIDRSSLQHNDIELLPGIFNECHRVLRQGGSMFSIMLKDGDNGFIANNPDEEFLKSKVLKNFILESLDYITVTENNESNQFTSYIIHAKK